MKPSQKSIGINGLLAILLLTQGAVYCTPAMPLRAEEPGAKMIAVVAPQRGALVDEVESRLRAGGQVLLAERSLVDAALQGLKVEALLEGSAIEARAALAARLKADLLVLVGTQGEAASQVHHIIVCEASHGLAIEEAAAAGSRELKDVADEFTKIVQAVARRPAAPLEVFSHPSMTDEGKRLRFHYLEAALPELAKAILSRRPQAIVLARQETEAFEQGIASGRTERGDALWKLTGSYAIHGDPDQPRLSLKLALAHGGEAGETLSREDVEIADAAKVLGEMLDELLGKVPGAKAAAFEPAVLAEQWAKRSKSLALLGRSEESWAAIEASLLLKPGQEELHHDAVVALASLFKPNWTSKDPAKERLAAAIGLRGLDHLLAFARCGGVPQKYGNEHWDDIVTVLTSAIPDSRHYRQGEPQFNALLAELLDHRVSVVRQALLLGARTGWRYGPYELRRLSSDMDMSERKWFAEALFQIERLKDLPDVGSRALNYAGSRLRDTPESYDYLDRLRAMKLPSIDAAVADMERELKKNIEHASEDPKWGENFFSCEPEVTTSELRIFAAQESTEASGKSPPLAAFDLAEEPKKSQYRTRQPLLARELMRQAILLAARHELQWLTRDAVLGETPPQGENGLARQLVLSTRFADHQPAEFVLRRRTDDGRSTPIWAEEIAFVDDYSGFPSVIDYARLAELAERWSREAFPALLKEEVESPSLRPQGDAQVPQAVTDWLRQLTCTAQYAAIRELHRTIREQGESDELLAALVRGYANLGVLSEFQWNSVFAVCKARSLLYAQRLVARRPDSAWRLRHRAYAEALCGPPRPALADLEAAEKLAEKAGGEKSDDRENRRPDWVPLIDEFCRFDYDALNARIAPLGNGQLAGLLTFLLVESDPTEGFTMQTAQRALEANLECFRIHDAMCRIGGIATLHRSTEIPPAILARAIPERLKELPNLPPTANNLLSRPIRSAGAFAKLIDSLADAAPSDDQGEFSWNVLGRMLREIQFIQLWRRVHFMRYQWSVPTDDFVDAILPLVAKHRYQPLIEMCGVNGQEWLAAARRLMDAIDPANVRRDEHDALSRALGKTWGAERVDHHSACWGKPESHRDDDYWGLLQTARLFHAAAPGYPAHRLLEFSPHSPAAHARLIETDWQFASQHADEWQRDFAGSPLVMRAFAQHYAKAGDAEATQRCLSAYLKRSPDLWAYRQLAKSYLLQNDRENWKATLDEFLTQEDYGLEHAQVRVEIANYFMDQQEWEQAQPYAEEAAETWAEWAMLCAVRCYQGLFNEEQEGAWLGRLLERYTSRNHAVNYFYWCHRTGLGDADVAMQILEPFLAAEQGGGSASDSHFIYLAANRRREALKAFQSQIKKEGIEPVNLKFYSSYIALLALELGETEAANDALKVLSAEKNNFALVFDLYKKFRDAGEGAKFDVDEARSIVKDLSATGRLNVSFFAARLMELAGQKQDAIEFYRISAIAPGMQLHINHCLARQALRRLGAELKGEDLKQAAKGG